MTLEPNEDNTPEEIELLAQARKGELTEANLQQKLNEYSLALKQEYETKTKERPDDLEEHTRDYFKDNLHNAAHQVVWLSNNADSESVRLSSCKLIIATALEQSKADGDPIAGLLAELTGKKKVVTTEPAPLGNDG